jgi:hypothetical protein
MSRTLSLNFREALNAQDTGEVAIFLLTIDHDELSSPIYLSTDPTERLSEVPLMYGTVSRSVTYIFIPMEIGLPDEREESPPRATFRISNVTRELVSLVRSVTTPAQAKLELVLASDLDTVEVESPWLDIVAATVTALDVSFELTLNSMATEMWPAESFDPSAFPGLFFT